MSRRYTICHKTEVVKNTLDPVWQAFKIPVRALCNGDYDRYSRTHKEMHECLQLNGENINTCTYINTILIYTTGI